MLSFCLNVLSNRMEVSPATRVRFEPGDVIKALFGLGDVTRAGFKLDDVIGVWFGLWAWLSGQGLGLVMSAGQERWGFYAREEARFKATGM